MIKFVAIGGCPATGKTTLAKYFMSLLSASSPFAFGLVKGTLHSQDKVLMLGLYPEGEVFGGTDRLSMAVQPAFEVLARQMVNSPDWVGWTVVFEGDRLFGAKTLALLNSLKAERVADYLAIVLTAGDAVAGRMVDRGSTQNPQWLAGRATKVAKVAADFDVPEFLHLTPEDTTAIVKKIRQFINE